MNKPLQTHYDLIFGISWPLLGYLRRVGNGESPKDGTKVRQANDGVLICVPCIYIYIYMGMGQYL